MDERRERPRVDIPPESDQAPAPGGEPPAADRVRPPVTGDPVVDADPTASDGTGGGRPEDVLGAGPVRGHDLLGPREAAPEERDPEEALTEATHEPTGAAAAPDLGEDALGGVAGAAVGAVAGAAAGGPAGAIVGAIVGAVGGAAVTEAASDRSPGAGSAGEYARPTTQGGPGPGLGAAGADPQNPAGTWTAAVTDGRPLAGTGELGDEHGPNGGDDDPALEEEDPAVPGAIERRV